MPIRDPRIGPIVPGGYAGSGVSPVSGGPQTTSGTLTFSGPFAVERQSMNITYVRVPEGMLTSHTLDLSSATGTYITWGTKLLAIITANYSMRKQHGLYAASSFQQPQKFEILAVSTDNTGMSYGDINASCLGPQGSIITSTEWYNRIPWNPSIHKVTGSSITAATFTVFHDSLTSGTSGLAYYPQPTHIYHFEEIFIPKCAVGSLISSFQIGDHYTGEGYRLGGSYSTSQETMQKIIAYIDSIGHLVQNEMVWDIPIDSGPVGAPKPSQIGIPEYDEGRHDYT